MKSKRGKKVGNGMDLSQAIMDGAALIADARDQH